MSAGKRPQVRLVSSYREAIEFYAILESRFDTGWNSGLAIALYPVETHPGLETS